MNQHVRELLDNIETVEITTTGRSSGAARRIEIWMYAIEGRYVITGTPGPRDWYANVQAKPTLTLHLPGGIDLDAVATPVTDRRFRRQVFMAEQTWWYRSQTPLEELIATSPMVELQFIE
ncbi:MAG: nitroreductase/quinone reductase family protein [Acidimicrobiia bacterium]|nr:nitroreductase/quinone reductase family protein [Acidimicrobiia bacterium]